jgi:hypothetical protein
MHLQSSFSTNGKSLHRRLSQAISGRPFLMGDALPAKKTVEAASRLD